MKDLWVELGIIFKKESEVYRMWRYALDLSSCRKRLLTSSCFQRNETLDYKERKFLEQLDGCHLLKKYSTAWSQLQFTVSLTSFSVNSPLSRSPLHTPLAVIWPSPQISHLVYMSTWLIPLWQAALPETIAPDVDWWTLSGQNNAACWGLELCASGLIVLLNVMTMSLSSLGFVVWIAITLSELWE